MNINNKTGISIGILIAVIMIIVAIFPIVKTVVFKENLDSYNELQKSKFKNINDKFDRFEVRLNQRLDKIEGKIDNLKR